MFPLLGWETCTGKGRSLKIGRLEDKIIIKHL